MKQFSKFDYLKFGMIPILLGALYAVLPKGTGPEAISIAQKTETVSIDGRMTEQSVNGRIKGTAVKESVTDKQWPSFQLSELKDINPFDRRMIFPELPSQSPAIDTAFPDRQSLVGITGLPSEKRLEAIKVQAVFQSPRGIAALVTGRVIHVGDRLDDGTEVTGITPEQLEISANKAY